MVLVTDAISIIVRIIPIQFVTIVFDNEIADVQLVVE